MGKLRLSRRKLREFKTKKTENETFPRRRTRAQKKHVLPPNEKAEKQIQLKNAVFNEGCVSPMQTDAFSSDRCGFSNEKKRFSKKTFLNEKYGLSTGNDALPNEKYVFFFEGK